MSRLMYNQLIENSKKARTKAEEEFTDTVINIMNASVQDAITEGANKIIEQAKNITSVTQNTQTSSTETNTIDDEDLEVIDNSLTTTDKDSLKRYGIRQEIIIKNDKEDSYQKAKRILTEHIRAKEEITVKCLGDIDYRVGFGVHIVIPFLTKYYDCFMYVKEVEHEWLNKNTFTSTLTLTPSRVMDEQEWSDITEMEDGEYSSGGSELWAKIEPVFKQQLGKPYVYGSNDAPNSFDCSSLVQYVYNQFSNETGVTLGRDTYSQCKQGREVSCASASDIPNSCQEGDLLFWKTSGNPPGHVSVYWGNNQMIHAPYTGEVVKIVDITRTDLYCVRRILPESVQVYDDGSVDLPSEAINKWKSFAEDAVNATLKNMEEYNYKNMLIKIAKKNGVDCYTVAGIISIESNGNPFCVSNAGAKGLMQVIGGSTDIATNLQQGCDVYNEKCNYYHSVSMFIALEAYNFGQGNVDKVLKKAGKSASEITPKEFIDNCNVEEAKWYACKVILAINILRSKNALG